MIALVDRFYRFGETELLASWLDATERTVTGMGYELVDAERTAGGLLRVTIDHPFVAPEAGPQPFINVDDCERVTRQLQHVLEVEAAAYERLEVSSPGLDRPLKKPTDYRRFVGEPVEITLKAPHLGRKKYRGELQPEGEGWRLLLSDDGEAPKKGATKVSPEKGASKVAPRKGAAKAAEAPRRALDFSLDEVRDARLVPVLDFKGRRFAAPAVGNPGANALPDEEMHGGGIQ